MVAEMLGGEQQDEIAKPFGTCAEQIERTQNCAMDILKKMGGSPKYRADMAKIKADKQRDISACFVDAGCEDPAPKMAALKSCLRNSAQKNVIQPLMDCSESAKLPVPAQFKRQLTGENGGMEAMQSRMTRSFMGGMNVGLYAKLDSLKGKIQSYCPDDDVTQSAVLQCGESVFKHAAIREEAAGSPGGFNVFGILNCVQHASERCRQEAEEKRQAMCECGQSSVFSEEKVRKANVDADKCLVKAGLEEEDLDPLEGETTKLARPESFKRGFSMGCTNWSSRMRGFGAFQRQLQG